MSELLTFNFDFDQEKCQRENADYMQAVDHSGEFDKAITYRPVEIAKTVTEKLLTLGCPKDKLLDVFAYIGHNIKEGEVNIQEAIGKAPDVIFRFLTHEESLKIAKFDNENQSLSDSDKAYYADVININNEEIADKIIKYLNLPAEELASPPHSFWENILRFSQVIYGMFAIGQNYNLIANKDLRYFQYMTQMILSSGITEKSLFHEYISFLYLSAQQGVIFEEIFIKTISLLQNMTLDDIDFNHIGEIADNEGNDNDFWWNQLRISRKKLYKLLKYRTSKKDRLTIFKLLSDLDFELLEEYISTGDAKEFCKYISTSAEYNDINAFCAFYDIIKRLCTVILYWSERHATDSKLWLLFINYIHSNKQYNAFFQLKTEAQKCSTFEDVIKNSAVLQSLEVLIDSDSFVVMFYNMLRSFFRPSMMICINNIIDESQLRDYFWSQIKLSEQAATEQDKSLEGNSISFQKEAQEGTTANSQHPKILSGQDEASQSSPLTEQANEALPSALVNRQRIRLDFHQKIACRKILKDCFSGGINDAPCIQYLIFGRGTVPKGRPIIKSRKKSLFLSFITYLLDWRVDPTVWEYLNQHFWDRKEGNPLFKNLGDDKDKKSSNPRSYAYKFMEKHKDTYFQDLFIAECGPKISDEELKDIVN